MDMDIWFVGTSNQLFITGSYTETKLAKNKVDTGKTAFIVIDPFCASHSICLNIGFWEGSFVCMDMLRFHSVFNCKTVLYFLIEKVFIFQKISFKVCWKN